MRATRTGSYERLSYARSNRDTRFLEVRVSIAVSIDVDVAFACFRCCFEVGFRRYSLSFAAAKLKMILGGILAFASRLSA